MRFKTISAVTALTVAVLGLGFVPSGQATEAATGSVIRPVRACADLKKTYDIPGAATRVTEANLVGADPTTGTPAYCEVLGVIEPEVKFRLRLPTDTYSGRYLQYGCGALCGVFFDTPFPECGGPHGGDFAVAATDDGHGLGVDERWAANNQAARNDFFYRAPHVTSRAAKRIIAAFYGSPPRTSYFTGCSTGGREGLLLAQRYPHDFDGIVASAPANYLGPLGGVYTAWAARSNTGADGAPIITAAKLPALHDAAVAACDRLDGLVDGQIDEPRACRFDPVGIQCPTGTDQPGCLTPAQVEAAGKLYAGPTDANGSRLYPGAQPPGSELAWDGVVTPSPFLGDQSLDAYIADNYLKYVLYPIGTPHSSLADFQFTAREFHRLTPESVKGNALSLDLREFRRSGGKLIMWHGWADPGIPPAATVDYYQRLVQRSGGQRATQEWARLFMVPTFYHCFGGDRLNQFDPFSELVGWVERGQAPDRIIAGGTNAQGGPRTRPVFPYPLQARYDGSGSVDDASNFVPARPSVPQRDIVEWVGSYLHHIPGPVAR